MSTARRTTTAATRRAAPAARTRAVGRKKPAAPARPAKPVVMLVGDPKALLWLRRLVRYTFEPRAVGVASAKAGKRLRRPERATIWALQVDDADLDAVVRGLAGVLARGDVLVRFRGAVPEPLADLVRAKRATIGAAEPLVRWTADGRAPFIGYGTHYFVEGERAVRAAVRRITRAPSNRLHAVSGYDPARLDAAHELAVAALRAGMRAAAAVLGEGFAAEVPAERRHELVWELIRRQLWQPGMRRGGPAGAGPDDPKFAPALAALADNPEARHLYRAALTALALPHT